MSASASYCCPVSTHGACAGPSAGGNVGLAPAVRRTTITPHMSTLLLFYFEDEQRRKCQCFTSFWLFFFCLCCSVSCQRISMNP